MDNYIATERLEQERLFVEAAKADRSKPSEGVTDHA